MAADYVIVGAGLFGSVFARQMADANRSVLIIDRRPHIGGNCYSERIDGIDVHRYGPHIFHTDNESVWNFVNRFAKFNSYRHRGVARAGERLFSFPINLQTLHQLWGVNTPREAKQILDEVREPIASPQNLEEWALSQVGRELYEVFVRGYTFKQWGRDPRELPAAILRRIPIRLTWDDSYFDDAHQGIPVDGYTRLFENLLDHPAIRIETGVDYFANRRELQSTGRRLVFTGMIDQYFDFRHGPLEYRSLRFETQRLAGDYQGVAIVNAADAHVPFTRSVEHKFFSMRRSDRTIVTREFPQAYSPGSEAFYPIGDDRNNHLYVLYRNLAGAEAPNVIFGGRLGSYRYYDMHQVIAQALHEAKRELLGKRRAA